MKGSFRQSMAWLHTGSGLAFGWLLFAVFFAGTIAVFRAEVDYWMRPELHRAHPGAGAIDLAQSALAKLAPDALRWSIELPTPRSPALRISWSLERGKRPQSSYIDAAGLPVVPRDTGGGTMIYRFHYGLLLGLTGMWVVGALGMAMLIGLVTGVITHAKIISDFFTFRPRASPQRAWLDAHNVSAVMVLPFSFMIAYSGLVIWWFIWMPAGWQVAYDGERVAFFADIAQRGIDNPPRAETGATLVRLASLPRAAHGVVSSAPDVRSIAVSDPGRGSSRIDMVRVDGDSMWGGSDRLRFDGTSGTLLSRIEETGPPWYVAFRVFRIIHEIKFADPFLRWLYFVMSAISCAMIGTGTVLWSVKRRARHVALLQQSAARPLTQFWAEAGNIGVIAGLCTATLAYFWANRLIPAAMSGRAGLETAVFFAIWALSLIAALVEIAARRNALGNAVSAQRVLRRLWARHWAVAASLALLLPAIDELSVDGVGQALRTGDGLVLGFHATVLMVGIAMVAAAWAASRIPKHRASLR